jgi:multidrug efflux pump
VRLSYHFIRRPVATTLLTAGIAIAGAIGYFKLPVSPLPQVDYPTISVLASQPGASPETMATSVATPLERHLGAISDVTEMTSSSSLGSTRITLQFGLDRDIDGAARDVQAAINAARVDLPTSLRSNPTYRKVNPADAPIMILALTSNTLSQGELYDSAATILQQKLSQVSGIGEVDLGGSSLPAVRVELQPTALFKYGIGLEDIRAALSAANANSPKGVIEQGDQRFQIYTNDQARKADQYKPLVVAYRNNSAVRRYRRCRRFRRKCPQRGNIEWRPGCAGAALSRTGRQHHRHGRPRQCPAAGAAGLDAARRQDHRRLRPIQHHPRIAG